MSLKSKLVHLKNSNPFAYYLWNVQQKKKGDKALRELSDQEAVISLYKTYSGRVPNLDNPKTFSEKQQWMKLNYHNPLMTTCADKYEVRQYVTQKGYAHLLNGVLGVYDKIEQLDVAQLPAQFVLKATHGSGWNLVCTDKSKINWWIWKKIMNVWLHNNIFWPGREWPYKNMKPRLIAEPFLKDNSGQLMDFKLFCFSGKVHFIQANKGRGTDNHAQNFYDLDWNILPFGKNLKPRPDIDIPAPVNLKEMARIAVDLVGDLPFVRVDFYEVDDKIIFGEMTFYPKSGLPDFTPPEYDQILGDLLILPKATV
ncbi:ATP-grasp fold amidoligase family protein [Flavobacterium tegetincola]|uniref:ATP-grasp fold amidoligase family protein n=1 Tax=Flavobacterium tegetincola TaxID=150172 RepID=UPI00040ED68A|nr:ATP-grasp fold amidoligase family protein [Flavobacterium tegetincola]